MSFAVRRVLYRAVDLVADPGHAARETGGDSVRAVVAGFAVRDFRTARAAGGVREFAADAGDVRGFARGGDGASDAVGSANAARAVAGCGSEKFRREKEKADLIR